MIMQKSNGSLCFWPHTPTTKIWKTIEGKGLANNLLSVELEDVHQAINQNFLQYADYKMAFILIQHGPTQSQSDIKYFIFIFLSNVYKQVKEVLNWLGMGGS